FQSAGFTPAALTSIATWEGPGAGTSRSTSRCVSGPPNAVKTKVFVMVCPPLRDVMLGPVVGCLVRMLRRRRLRLWSNTRRQRHVPVERRSCITPAVYHRCCSGPQRFTEMRIALSDVGDGEVFEVAFDGKMFLSHNSSLRR